MLPYDSGMNRFSLSTSAPEANLRRLLIIRGLFLLMVCATLAYSFWQLHMPLAYRSILWVISGMTLISVATLLQLHLSHRASQLSFFGQLLIDIAGVSLLLFFTGGANNPFVSYYLVPLCVAAATLPRRLVWPLVLIALALYTTLIFYNVPLPDLAPPSHHNHAAGAGNSFSLHSLGMWINFLVSALLISYFVLAMAASLRQQDEDLARLREDRLRDDQLMSLATLAAGTAHELGSPLTTIKTLVKEMQADYCDPKPAGSTPGDLTLRDDLALKDDLALLQTQIAHCTDTLRQLNRQAGELKDGILPQQSVRQYCSKVINDWLLLRPEVEATLNIDAQAPEVDAFWPPLVAQSISNLLNNAADANPVGLDIQVSWNPLQLTLQIHDQGPGIDPALATDLGKAFVSHKGEGRGLGLFLSRAAIERYQGNVSLENHPGGGALTTLCLPLMSVSP